MAAAVEETCPPIRRLRAAFAIAPKIATPSALPIERPNTNVPVTTPRRSHSTEDCAAISVGLATNPMPKPSTKQVAATIHTELRADSKVSRPEPMTTTAPPISAVRRKPIFM